MAKCTLCKKGAVTGNQISHAQNHTKRKFKANLQKVNGLLLCTKCLKTIKTVQRENAASKEIPAEIVQFEEEKEEQIEVDKEEAAEEAKEEKKEAVKEAEEEETLEVMEELVK